MFLDVFMMENEVIKYGSILPVKLEIIGDTNLQLRVYQINLKLLNSAHSWQLNIKYWIQRWHSAQSLLLTGSQCLLVDENCQHGGIQDQSSTPSQWDDWSPGMALPRAHAEKVGLNSTQWGYNKPELILGSSHLRIQSSHLVITFSAGLHSSHGRNLQPSLLHFAILCLSFLYTGETIIFILPKNLVRAPILVWVGLLKEKRKTHKRVANDSPWSAAYFRNSTLGWSCRDGKRSKMWREQEKNMLAQYSTRNPATQVKSKTFSPLIVRDTNLGIEQW